MHGYKESTDNLFETFEFTKRTEGILNAAGINTVDDLLDIEKLITIRDTKGVGPAVISEIFFQILPAFKGRLAEEVIKSKELFAAWRKEQQIKHDEKYYDKEKDEARLRRYLMIERIVERSFSRSDPKI